MNLHRNTCLAVAIAVWVMGGFAGIVHADDVLFVDDDASPGGNGQSWNEAYRFLQDALRKADVPANGITEIRVAQGIYFPDRDESTPHGTGDRMATFHLISGVTLKGGYWGLGDDDDDDDGGQNDVSFYQSIL